MIGVGIGCGIIGTATIAAVLYMMERGYAWWQIALVVLVAACFAPQYRSTDG